MRTRSSKYDLALGPEKETEKGEKKKKWQQRWWYELCYEVSLAGATVPEYESVHINL